MSNVFVFRQPPPGFIDTYFGGGGKGGTSTQSVTIPPEVLARYNSVNARAEDTAKQPFQQYGGEFVAPLTPTQVAGTQATNAASSQAQPYYGAATALTLGGARDIGPLTQNQIGYYQNPYTQAVVNPTVQALQQQQGQQLAEQQAQAIKGGAFGGERAGLQRAQLQGQQNLALGQAIAPLYQQGYGQAVQTAQQQQGVVAQDLARQMQAGQQVAGLGTGAQQAALQGAQAQLAAGQVGQQTQQAQDTAQYQQFLQQRGYDFQVAQFLANIAMGTGALSGSTTTSTQPGGFFSDKRLKDDVKEIGETHDGQPIYSYKYKGDDRTQIGLMAQDVEKKHPDAVGLMGGYKTVDYKKATEGAERTHKDMGGGLMPDGFDPNSMGGAVNPDMAGEGFERGGYVGGGLVGNDDWAQIIAANKQALGMYGGAQPMGGSPGAMGGLNIPTSAATPKLVTAGALPQQRPSGMSTAMQTGKDIAGTYKGGKEFLLGAPKSSSAEASAGLLGGGGELKGKSWGGELKDWWNTPSPAATGGLIVPRHAYAGGGNDEEDPSPYNVKETMSGEDPMKDVLKSGSQHAQLMTAKGPGGQGGQSGLGQLAGGLGAAKSLYGMGTGAASGLADLGAGFSSAGNAAGLDAALGPGFFAENIGLGAGGASAAGSGLMGSIGSGLGTAAAGAGASIMEALPFLAMFSDERLKDNIRPVGKTFDGQNIYSYNIGEGPTQMGLMAQEVLDRKPEAVGRRGEYLTVDYDRATEDASPYATGGLVPRHAYADGGSEEVPAQATELPAEQPVDDRLDRTLGALRRIESGGRYDITGPASRKGDRPYGAYQVMGANIPSWTEEALGRRMAPDEFLKDDKAQDATARHRAGLYLKQYDDPRQVASMWLSGKPMEKAGNVADVLGTNVPKYVSMFDRYYDGQDLAPSGKQPGLKPPADIGGATSSGAEGKKGLVDTVTSEGFVVPALGFLGSMLASNKPNLGQALGEGIMGGVGAYQSQKKQTAELAKGVLDIVKDRFHITTDPKTGQTVYFNKATGTPISAGQYAQAVGGIADSLGVPRGVLGIPTTGIDIPSINGGPTKPGEFSRPGLPLKQGEAPKVGEQAAETKPSDKPATVELVEDIRKMGPTQLMDYASKNKEKYGLVGDRDPDVKQQEFTEYRRLAQSARLSGNTADAAAYEKLAQDSQDRVKQYLSDAVKLQLVNNEEIAKANVQSSQKYMDDVTTRIQNYDTARSSLKRLADIYSNYEPNRAAEIKANIGDWANQFGVDLGPNFNAAAPDEAIKIATAQAISAAGASQLGRAPKVVLENELRTVPSPRLAPGAIYSILGRTIGEIDYANARDRAYAEKGTGTEVPKFLNDFTKREKPGTYIGNAFAELPVVRGMKREEIDSLMKSYNFTPKQEAGAAPQAGSEQPREAAPAAPSAPEPIRNLPGLVYSPSRNQYRDAQGNLYNSSGQKVQ